MPTALVSSSQEPDAPPLTEDLAAFGFTVVDASDRLVSLQDVVRTAPDFVIMHEESPDAAHFEVASAISNAAPRPVVMFTIDPSAEKMEQAIRSGIHAYVVRGYARARLRSVIHLAQARFRFDQMMRDELAEVNQRFAERKLVDRAKGILMGARQLREEQAYSALRTAAMRTKQRIGQVARQVIDSARFAEAVNRAGQLRMLSQRLVKLYALACTGTRPAETAALAADSIGCVDANLAILGRSLSELTYGDLIAAVTTPWDQMRRVLSQPAVAGHLQALDALADEMLVRAEILTESLEVAGFAMALHIINVCGRQRMLSQRLAKDALLAAMLPAGAARQARLRIATTRAQIDESLRFLDTLPMTNADIAAKLDEAKARWLTVQALPDVAVDAERDRWAQASELMLASFEDLTGRLEYAIHAMVG